TVLVLATVAGGIGMMCFGVVTWSQDYAPVKWLTGIFMLCAVPLELCLLQPFRKEAPYLALRAEVLALKPASVDRWVLRPSPPIGPLAGKEIEP
ncbi:MAG: hypothetical protein ACE5JI_22720, partial [Acidobacteriota bacterium]